MSIKQVLKNDAVRITASAIVYTMDGTVMKQQGPVPATDNNYQGIAMWGSNNLLPQDMLNDIKATSALKAAIDAKARVALGKGVYPARITGITKDGYEELEFINDPEIRTWLDMNNSFKNSYANMYNLFGHGQSFIKIICNSDRSKILGYKVTPTQKCRFETFNESTGRIENVVVNADWSKYSATDQKHTEKIPLLDRDFPLQDLQSRTSGTVFMIVLQYPLMDNDYYAIAPWYSAVQWVKIAQSIPALKKAIFKNQMSLKYVVNIHQKFWSLYDPTYDSAIPEKQKSIQEAFYDQVDKYLVGDDNAGKALWSTPVYDAALQKYVPAVEVIVLEDKLKEGKLLPDSAAANIEIMLPLLVNAAMLGIDMPGGDAYGGGAGSGSNIREAYLVQIMLVELERQLNATLFKMVSIVNGWGDGIVFRYPNQMLTTLNTGANTQPTA